MKNKKKVCLICAAGGHLEQIRQLKSVIEEYDCYYMVNRTKATEKMQVKKHIISAQSNKNNVLFVITLIWVFIQQLFLFILENPDVIITTGAGFVIPTCIYGKIFGKKVIYIETFAKINKPSETGKFIYKHKIADLFIVQHKKCLDFFPEATLGGWIY